MHDYLVVSDERAGAPLDEFLALRWPRVAKGRLRRLVRDGWVTVGGGRVQPDYRLRAGQVVLVEAPEEALKEIAAAPLPIEILHRDEHLLAINKPPGLPVEPSRWGEHPLSLAGAMAQWAEQRPAADGLPAVRPRALHRLDLGTSGVLLYALSLEAERYYRELFAGGLVEKVYHALVIGELREAGYVDLRLAPDRHDGSRMVASPRHGKEAYTEYRPLQVFRGYSLVEARPRTGRTHQVRVHLAAVGHPLVVDPRYGGRDKIFLSELKSGYRPKAGREERPLIDRLTLHARSVRLTSLQGPELLVEAGYPKDLQVVIGKLEKWRRAREETTRRLPGFRSPG